MSEYDLYPDKPVIKKVEKKSRLDITIFTMVLFVSSFLLIFQESLSFVLLLLLVLLIHELGHFAFMKIFKYRNVRMLFVPLMGAFVQGVKDKYSQWQSFLVVLAGPIPGVLLGLVAFVLAQNNEIGWLMTLSFLFIALNVLNLLPLDPLDGGQILKLLIGSSVDVFQLVFSLISSLTLIGLGLYFDEYIVIGFGFLMGFRVRNLQKNYLIRKELISEEVDYKTTYDDLSNKDYAKIKEIVVKNNRALKKYVEMNENSEEIEPMIASQVQGILEAPIIKDTAAWQKILIILIWIACFILPFGMIYFTTIDLSWYFSGL